MERYIVFYASTVDSSTVTAHDTGTNVDLGCFKVSNISAIMGEEDMIYIYFKGSGRFEDVAGTTPLGAGEMMEQSFVKLTVAEGREVNVIEELAELFTENKTYDLNRKILFDAVNGVWPISNQTWITAIQIRRHLTTHTISSD